MARTIPGPAESDPLAAWCAFLARARRLDALEGGKAATRLAADDGLGFPATFPSTDQATTRLLIANRLAPAVVRACGAASDRLDPAVRAAARTATEQGLAALASVREIASALDAADIPWLLWKGPALAMQAWGDPCARAYADLDVVVPPEQLDAARAALARLGWMAPPGMGARTLRVVHAGSGAIPLHRAGRPLVELHWRFLGAWYPRFLAVRAVWARAEAVDLAGTRVRTPSGADALVLLAAHATKHGWTLAEEVVTYSRLAARFPGAALEAAMRGDALPTPIPMALAERLRARLCVDTAPPALDTALDTALAVRVDALAATCLTRMKSADTHWRETAAWRAAWLDRAGLRARAWLAALVLPSPLDWEWVRLPDGLAWAYPAVRLLRLTVRALSAPARLRR